MGEGIDGERCKQTSFLKVCAAQSSGDEKGYLPSGPFSIFCILVLTKSNGKLRTPRRHMKHDYGKHRGHITGLSTTLNHRETWSAVWPWAKDRQKTI